MNKEINEVFIDIQKIDLFQTTKFLKFNLRKKLARKEKYIEYYQYHLQTMGRKQYKLLSF